jgi:hypothetical protein
MRVKYPLATAVAGLGLLAPAAHADRPTKGSFFNSARDGGGYLINSKHSIKELWLYCGGARYAVRELIRIKSDGSFRLRKGSAERFGWGGAPRGIRDVRLSGRFTSNDSVRIKGTLEQCGTRTIVLTRQR